MPLTDKSEFSALLARAGIAPATADIVMDIDGVIQQWRRKAMKRELASRALLDLGINLELQQFDVLAVIVAPVEGQTEIQEVMVSTVAERLSIDPSRASRLVSDMVEKGYARRAVSQADARRTIIELTERGQTVVDAVRAYKFLIMGDFLAEWEKDELAAFLPLLQRFSTWVDNIEASTEKHAADIAELAAGLKTAAPKGTAV